MCSISSDLKKGLRRILRLAPRVAPFDRRQRRRFKSSTRAFDESTLLNSTCSRWLMPKKGDSVSTTWSTTASTHSWMWLGMAQIS